LRFVTPSKIAIAWCLLNPEVSNLILDPLCLEQLQENLAAAEDLREMNGHGRRFTTGNRGNA
jgi:hypothetical protein